jgi:4-aminobutyrate aminotransferase-like enzyme
MAVIDKLAPLRAHGGKRRTVGLDDAVIARFAASHPDLIEAVDAAAAEYAAIRGEFADLLDLDEAQLRDTVQAGYVNFYADDGVNPYIALAARGPWVVTLKGAVLHDSGGYGMLGFGHTPQAVIDAMAKPQAMANIMTPSLSQLRFEKAIRAAIGLNRGGCPYEVLCLNSGSESVSLAARIVDANAKTMTDPGARHAGRHHQAPRREGQLRPHRAPCPVFDSSRKTYMQYLASFRGEDSVIAVEPYDIDALKKVFTDADANGWFVEAMFLER